MTRERFTTFLIELQREECELREAGQKEYAHDENNCMANFERTGSDLDISREKVLMIFARKHWDGIVSHINGHTSQRENVRGRILDLRVYLALLAGMLDDNESGS